MYPPKPEVFSLSGCRVSGGTSWRSTTPRVWRWGWGGGGGIFWGAEQAPVNSAEQAPVGGAEQAPVGGAEQALRSAEQALRSAEQARRISTGSPNWARFCVFRLAFRLFFDCFFACFGSVSSGTHASGLFFVCFLQAFLGCTLLRPTGSPNGSGGVSFFNGLPNPVLILVRPTRSGLILVRPTCARYWLAQLRFDTGSPNRDFACFWQTASSRGGGAEAFGWDRGETPETPETPLNVVRQGCLRCLRCLTPVSGLSQLSQPSRLVGPAPASTKCGDFCQFFWRSHSTPKRLRGTAGLFVEFFDTQRDGLGSPNPLGLDTGPPNLRSILARPTSF